MSSSRLGSPEALYRAAPHVDANPNASQIELGDDEIEAHHSTPQSDLPSFLVDARIRWIHLMLGCVVLLPWNVIITAMPFFSSRLAKSSLGSTFGSYLTTSFTAANFVFLAHATAVSKNTRPSRQTLSCIFFLIWLNFFLTLSTFFSPSPGVFFAFILANGTVQAIVGAYLQTSVIAVASLFGPPAVQAMMSGQAAVGVAVSAVQVVSAAGSVWGKPTTYVGDGSAEERSAYAFFSLSTLFLIASAVAFIWMTRQPVYQTVVAPLEKRSQNAALLNEDCEDEGRGLMGSQTLPPLTLGSERANAIRVAKVNATYEVAVAYVFIITLAVFPPITTSIQSTNPDVHPLLFSAVHFLVFNVGDFLGRYVCSFRAFLVWNARRLLTLSLGRTLFVPLFLMCNIKRASSMAVTAPIISSDFLYMFILMMFGFSNGYVSSLCMMAAPSLEHNPRLKGRPEDVDVAATVASFCLVGGLAIGSIVSFGVKAAVCGCNPFTT